MHRASVDAFDGPRWGQSKTGVQMRQYLFAYGTLLSGALDPRVDMLLRQHCRPGAEATVAGRLVDLGAYPGALKPTRRDQRIHGRLVELLAPAKVLPLLDAYEDYSPDNPMHSMYRREHARAELAGGDTCECWIYWLARPPRSAAYITGGNWLRWKAQINQERKIGR